MWSRSFWLLVALALPAPAAAGGGEESACVDRAVRLLQQRYETIRDFRAGFAQTTRSVSMGNVTGDTTASRGTVAFAKPGRMRWVYETPEPGVVVSDGSTLWLYDPLRKEVQQLPVGEGYLSGAAIQFLLGQGDLRRDFRVTPLACDTARIELELLPRAAAAYERLRVRVDPETGDVVGTAIVDILGNVTEIDFSEIRTNLDPAAEEFVFEAPDGVRVIELEAPR